MTSVSVAVCCVSPEADTNCRDRAELPSATTPCCPLWLIRKQRTRTSNIWLAPATGHGRASTAADKQKTVSHRPRKASDLVPWDCQFHRLFLWASDLPIGWVRRVNISVFEQLKHPPRLLAAHLISSFRDSLIYSIYPAKFKFSCHNNNPISKSSFQNNLIHHVFSYMPRVMSQSGLRNYIIVLIVNGHKLN